MENNKMKTLLYAAFTKVDIDIFFQFIEEYTRHESLRIIQTSPVNMEEVWKVQGGILALERIKEGILEKTIDKE